MEKDLLFAASRCITSVIDLAVSAKLEKINIHFLIQDILIPSSLLCEGSELCITSIRKTARISTKTDHIKFLYKNISAFKYNFEITTSTGETLELPVANIVGISFSSDNLDVRFISQDPQTVCEGI